MLRCVPCTRRDEPEIGQKTMRPYECSLHAQGLDSNGGGSRVGVRLLSQPHLCD
jgi:hypothetical protein